MFWRARTPVITGVTVFGVVPQSPLPVPNFAIGRHAPVGFSEKPAGGQRCVVFRVSLPRRTDAAAILARVADANDPVVLALAARLEGERILLITASGPAVDTVLDSVNASLAIGPQACKEAGLADYFELLSGLVRSLKETVTSVLLTA